MRSIALVIIAALCVSAGPVMAQQDFIYDSKGREKGYSRNIGGQTYYYDKSGKERGSSQTYGGRTYDFNNQGREVGYQQDLGGKTYIFGDRGGSDPVGYFRPSEGTASTEKPSGKPDVPDSQDVFNYGPGGYSWGVSGPAPEGGDE
ncbi:hypothetical protein ACFL4E_00465 [Candidatus Omnitrophota bacterium]